MRRYLDELGIAYEVDPRIVRGLDYYTRTVFEITSTALGAQSTVCGGGRYDGLVASLGGPPTPAVGFGLGLERFLMMVDAARGGGSPARRGIQAIALGAGGARAAGAAGRPRCAPRRRAGLHRLRRPQADRAFQASPTATAPAGR